MALQAKAAFHGALLSTKSTPEDVANFGLLVDDLTEELEVGGQAVTSSPLLLSGEGRRSRHD